MRDHDQRIAEMFDRIAPRYDRLNRVLSFGTDRSWRATAVALARLGPSEVALDVGAGTGDLALGLLRASAPDTHVIGLDLAARMLAISRRRAERAGLGRRYATLIGNAEALPLPDASVDRVVSGFTLRNIGDLPRALTEMLRVLRPGGSAVLLELSHPPNPLFRTLYIAYFEQVLPRLAALLGGDTDAYRYLPRSLRPFPDAERLASLLNEAGFSAVRYERLSFGIAAVHLAERAPEHLAWSPRSIEANP
jgi:demethylmenaquinone methyltransferase/2-methoxy-6-polyprenyl-1,4-benzoquinol methylase